MKRNALISVYDKSSLKKICRIFNKFNIGIISTGATAKEIINLGASHVILKGGHMETQVITDLLITPSETHSIQSSKIFTNHTHGTGCTMASALTACLAKSHDIKYSFEAAHTYVNKAIKTSPKFGFGNGPINHCYNINEIID